MYKQISSGELVDASGNLNFGSAADVAQKNAPQILSSALGLSPEQTAVAQDLYKQISSGGLTDASGNLNFGSVANVAEKNAPQILSSALGLTPEQTTAAQDLYKQISSGGLTDASGNLNFGSASNLATTLGQSGLIDADTSKKISGALTSLNSNDVLGAAAQFSGYDAQAVKSLFAEGSSAEERGSAALKLGLGADIPAAKLDQAISGIGNGDYSAAIEVLSSASGDGATGDIAKGLNLAKDVYETSKNPNASTQDWTNLGLQVADQLDLSDGTKRVIKAAPQLVDTYQAFADGDPKSDPLKMTANLAQTLIPGDEGALVSDLLNVAGGEAINYGNTSESLLKVAGVDDKAANAVGDAVSLVQHGGSTASIAGAVGSAATALGAPKEVGAAAMFAQGIAAGGFTGYGLAAQAVGQIIGGKVGEWVGKVGAYAAAAASGPVGWAAGVVMLAVDLLGFKP
ncbi:MAG: hypothetical protein ACRDAM_15355, partial [Casimicrobium sp.]